MKPIFKITVLSLILLVAFASCITETTYIKPNDEKQTEILLVGTFHFNNPGLDIVKNKAFDIKNSKTQTELDIIAQKIADFNPTKIFVERPYQNQKELDSTYNLYKKGTLPVSTDEIYQLAFRVAKLNKNTSLEAIDYNDFGFPFGEVMEIMETRKQTDLKEKIMNITKEIGNDFNKKLENGISLTNILLYHNTDEFRYHANHIYDIILNAGNETDFEAAHLLAQWNNRNLYMYSLLKKKITKKDERVMVLLGASHIANIKVILDANKQWKTVELKDVLTKKTY
ncbi:MAG TPA: hypothetical protein EYP87_07610 [Flavobacteriaceae bacterium]|nr:hypothetical protein [Flavobacteriaceae bacterium]